MSSLNNLISKLAGADSSTVAESVESTQAEQNATDPVYVEKLASAVDFIVDNIDLSQPEEADPRVQIIKEAVGRDPVTGRFVSDKKPETIEDMASNIANISDRIRDRLRARIAAKQEVVEKEEQKTEQANEANQEVLQNVLGKLKELKSDAEPEATQEDKAEDTQDDSKETFYSGSDKDDVSEEEIFNVGNTATDTEKEEASSEADGEAAVKAASVGQSLADVLNAALSSDEQVDESVPQDAKTASVHSSEGPLARKQATDNLKKKLMARIGKEA